MIRMSLDSWSGLGVLQSRLPRASRRGAQPEGEKDLMKKIEAIIQPHKLDEVKDALIKVGVDGMTVSEVRGTGVRKVTPRHIAAREYKVDLLRKSKLRWLCPTHAQWKSQRPWRQPARSGKVGDGKIFVTDVLDAIRIRNDDRGESAL